jgi:hypothetical protein
LLGFDIRAVIHHLLKLGNPGTQFFQRNSGISVAVKFRRRCRVTEIFSKKNNQSSPVCRGDLKPRSQ